MLFLLAALAGGWWYTRQPKTYRLVRQFPLILCPVYGHPPMDGADIRQGILYTGAGLLIRTDPTHLVLYDWDGLKRWTISTEKSEKDEWQQNPPTMSYIARGWVTDPRTDIAVSPNGVYVVAALFTPKWLTLTTLKNGRQIGTIQIPINAPSSSWGWEPPLVMTVMDSGQTLLAIQNEEKVQTILEMISFSTGKRIRTRRSPVRELISQNDIYIIDGVKINARGKCDLVKAISPDGLLLVTEGYKHKTPYFYYRITWQRQTISFPMMSPGTVAPYRMIGYGELPLQAQFPLLANGYIFSGDTVDDAKTTRAKLKYPGTVFAPPGARHLLEYGPNGQFEVLDLTSLKTWGVTAVGAYGGGVLTLDGKHILQIPGHRNSYRFAPPVERLCQRYPALRERLIDTAPRALILYEAPGKFVARLPLQPARYSRGLGLTGSFYQNYSLDGLYPSPDGRTLIAVAKRPGDKKYQCLAFRYR
jgi:hypothetical protein